MNRTGSFVDTVASTVLRNDPSRVSFLFVNLGAFLVFITPRGEPSATNGIRLEANGGGVSAEWETDGEVVAWAWRAISVGGLTDVFILENLIDAGREPAPRGGAPAGAR